MYCRKGFSKRSLIASALALLLCVFMFVGASYAWFADSLSSGTTRIAGKNLEVDLLMDTGKNGQRGIIGRHLRNDGQCFVQFRLVDAEFHLIPSCRWFTHDNTDWLSRRWVDDGTGLPFVSFSL